MDTLNTSSDVPLKTRILSIKSLHPPSGLTDDLGSWFEKHRFLPESENILKAAELLCTSSIPVAFPTETVYGLGADATRSSAVLGIYKAKRRPADNPLIVHVSSIDQLRRLLRPNHPQQQNGDISLDGDQDQVDPIPLVYAPLISRFWPGPLTILLPNPSHSPLAPEVTSGLPTFGCRIPSSPLARLLIHLADRPLAAPSANASTRPSPTTAQHVLGDLDGRIEIILDGGPCNVGVESTVVDGLSDPPAILRPGGIGIEEIRSCGGKWLNVVKGYKDRAEGYDDTPTTNGETDVTSSTHNTEQTTLTPSSAGPRAPGMKYKHYSPRARVILFEASIPSSLETATSHAQSHRHQSPASSIGILRTRHWSPRLSLPQDISVHDIHLGASATDIAKNLFSALRELDEKGVDVILVEGIDDGEGELAAAVMNRIRKAAEVDIKS